MSAKRDRPMDLAEQLRQAIRDSGLTPYRIATDADVDRAILVRFLTHERDIRMETAGRIAAYLNLELRPQQKRKRKVGE